MFFHRLSKYPTSDPVYAAEGVLAGLQLGAAIHIARLKGNGKKGESIWKSLLFQVLGIGALNALAELALGRISTPWMVQVPGEDREVVNARMVANVIIAFAEGAFEEAVEESLMEGWADKVDAGRNDLASSQLRKVQIFMVFMIFGRDLTAGALAGFEDERDVMSTAIGAAVNGVATAYFVQGKGKLGWVMDKLPAVRKRAVKLVTPLMVDAMVKFFEAWE